MHCIALLILKKKEEDKEAKKIENSP